MGIDEIVLQPPITSCVICVVVNSAKMLGYDDPEKAKRELGHPRFTVKTSNTLVGHMGIVRSPRGGIRPEVEIAVITMGRIRRGKGPGRNPRVHCVQRYNSIHNWLRRTRTMHIEGPGKDPASGEIRREYVRGAPFIRKTGTSLAS